MRIHEIFNEGLVKYPPRIEAEMFEKALPTFLWYLRSKFPAGSEHAKAITVTAKQYGVKLPRGKFVIPDSGFSTFKINFDLSGMPNYEKLKPIHDECWLVLNFTADYLRRKNNRAYYRPYTMRSGDEISMIVFDMTEVNYNSRMPPEEINYFISDFRRNLRHELRHMTQKVLLEPKDPRQYGKEPDYDEHGHGYYASHVERDPQIADAVEEFINDCRTAQRYGKSMVKGGNLDLETCIKQMVGAIKASNFGLFQPHDVFKALKQRDPEGWRRAVKKFVVELRARLAETGFSPNEA